MDTFLLVLVACVCSSLGTGVGCVYLILRPGGFLERLDAARDQRINSLLESSSVLKTEMVQLESQVRANQHLVTTVTDAIGTRMTSFESRFGKYAAKTEKQQMIDEAFALARNSNNGG